MAHWSAEALRNRRAGQQKIRRRCSCGRVITGNAAWWSHTHTKDGDEKAEHQFHGRA